MNLNISFKISLNPSEPKSLYRVKTDAELGRKDRLHLPMVYYFAETAMRLTREWQLYIMFINPGVAPNYLSALFNYKKAYANGDNGYGGGKVLQNWFTGENLDAKDVPVLPKCWTGGDAIVEYRNGIVELMDGNILPDYSKTPQFYPHLFFPCVTTGDDGYAHYNFPGGAFYSWFKNGSVPVIFLPHVRCGGSIPFPPPVSQQTDNTAVLTPVV